MDELIKLRNELAATRTTREQAEAHLAQAIVIVRYLFYYRLPLGNKVEDLVGQSEERRWREIFEFLSSISPPPILAELDAWKRITDDRTRDVVAMRAEAHQSRCNADSSDNWRQACASAENERDALKAELEQEKKWKIEDPRMLREQIRIADAAFNYLHETHAALKIKLEVATAALTQMSCQCLPPQTICFRCEALAQLNESEKKK